MAKVYYSAIIWPVNQKAQTGLEKQQGTIKRELGPESEIVQDSDLTVKDESVGIDPMRCAI